MGISKKLIFITFCLALSVMLSKHGVAQVIDKATINAWPQVSEVVSVSANGRYACYLQNSHNSSVYKLFDRIKKITTNISSASEIKFAKDSQSLFYIRNDSLFKYDFRGKNIRFICLSNTFKIIGKASNYFVTSYYQEGGLVAFINEKNDILFFNDIAKYMLINEKYCLIEQKNVRRLNLIEISSGKIKRTFQYNSNEQVTEVTPTKEGSKLLLVSKNATSGVFVSVIDALNLEEIYRYSLKGVPGDITINPLLSKNQRFLFFTIPSKYRSVDDTASNLTVWSYNDKVIMPQKIVDEKKQKFQTYSIDLKTGVQRLAVDADEFLFIAPDEIEGDHLLIAGGNQPYWWPVDSSYYKLISLSTGKITFIDHGRLGLMMFSFSPNGRYLVYFDKDQGLFESLDLATGTYRKLTGDLASLFLTKPSKSIINSPAMGVAKWADNESSLYIYDDYDIWQLSASGKFSPRNITGGYGRKNKTRLRLIPDGKYDFQKYNGKYLLTGVDDISKQNGFYYLDPLNTLSSVVCLIKSNHVYYREASQISAFYSYHDGIVPVKAENANCWAVMRQSYNEFPNLYFTQDFKKFTNITDLQPQRKLNWLTAELLNWEMPDKSICSGILYKPENFDSNKKYPVIFNFYERLSQRLFQFPQPDYSGTNINVPWFISRGYLVFCPDIHFKPANTSQISVGGWANISIEAAAHYLSKLPYIDSTKMALQGHSFGAMEVAYIVTHNKRFAAAAESAGATDAISRYLTLVPLWDSSEHQSLQESMELNHELYGAPLWDEKSIYIDNSPVLNANFVSTPLLIMHNPKDNQVAWRQGVEFYMALRRLSKPSWMLVYKDSGHSLSGRPAEDYTIRLTQFFDHYLKGTPVPGWMTQGRPTKMKAIEDDHALDRAFEP